MATNPILIGFFIGMLARYADVSLGGVPKTVIDMIAASAVPCALFALGLALHRYGIAGDLTLSVVISALKLMLLPLAVWLLVRTCSSSRLSMPASPSFLPPCRAG
jgi:predicted permease